MSIILPYEPELPEFTDNRPRQLEYQQPIQSPSSSISSRNNNNFNFTIPTSLTTRDNLLTQPSRFMRNNNLSSSDNMLPISLPSPPSSYHPLLYQSDSKRDNQNERSLVPISHDLTIRPIQSIRSSAFSQPVNNQLLGLLPPASVSSSSLRNQQRMTSGPRITSIDDDENEPGLLRLEEEKGPLRLMPPERFQSPSVSINNRPLGRGRQQVRRIEAPPSGLDSAISRKRGRPAEEAEGGLATELEGKSQLFGRQRRVYNDNDINIDYDITDEKQFPLYVPLQQRPSHTQIERKFQTHIFEYSFDQEKLNTLYELKGLMVTSVNHCGDKNPYENMNQICLQFSNPKTYENDGTRISALSPNEGDNRKPPPQFPRQFQLYLPDTNKWINLDFDATKKLMIDDSGGASILLNVDVLENVKTDKAYIILDFKSFDDLTTFRLRARNILVQPKLDTCSNFFLNNPALGNAKPRVVKVDQCGRQLGGETSLCIYMEFPQYIIKGNDARGSLQGEGFIPNRTNQYLKRTQRAQSVAESAQNEKSLRIEQFRIPLDTNTNVALQKEYKKLTSDGEFMIQNEYEGDIVTTAADLESIKYSWNKILTGATLAQYEYSPATAQFPESQFISFELSGGANDKKKIQFWGPTITSSLDIRNCYDSTQPDIG